MNWLIVSAVLAAAVCSGCASAPKSRFNAVDAGTSQVLRDSRAIRIEVGPGKVLEHHGGAEDGKLMAGMMFGPIGGLVGLAAATSSAQSKGATLAEIMALNDPGVLVAERMKERLSTERVAENDPDVRLEVRTVAWLFNKKAVAYHVALDVFPGTSSKAATGGVCRAGRTLKAIGLDPNELLADSAAALKQEYEDAATHCADYFVGELWPGGSDVADASGSR